MPNIRINTSEAESLKPIPEDAYPMEVIEVGDTEEGPKAHYVPVKLRVTDGEHQGRTFYQNLPIEGKGAGIFISFINKALNLDYDVDDMEHLDFDTDSLLGAEVIGNVENKEYPKGSGEIRSQIKSIASRYGTGPGIPSEASEVVEA